MYHRQADTIAHNEDSTLNEYIAVLAGFTIPFCYTLFAIHHYYLLPYLDKNEMPKAIHIVLSILVNLLCIVFFSSLMEIMLDGFSTKRYPSFNGFNIF
ncbi:hypothetical protein [Sphingobacterium pedocola]|uniref:hypothetical protein n=1 Tax=Sphingobacterium pedocola TaxID=2082722 RepID=UPI0018CA344E|nr:hypothetical protein [Sphingobacterium pedocola]